MNKERWQALSPFCHLCPLREQAQIKDEIEGSGGIWFVGERPADEEVKQGRPFVGKSGQLLRELLREAGIKDYALTNLIRCAPPPDITPAQLAAAQTLCAQNVLAPALRNAEKIVALGQISTQVLTQLGFKVVSAPHPAAVLRNPALKPKLRFILQTLNHSTPPLSQVDYIVIEPNKVGALLTHLSRVPYFVIDFEVGGKNAYDPKAPLLCAAIATADKTFYLLPLKEHGVEPYIKVFEVVRQGNWIAHNAIFEALWLYRVTGQVPRRPYADTLLMYYALNESAQGYYDLKHLAKTLLGAPDWEKDIEPYLSRHCLEFCPPKILYDYCVKDTYWTLLLYQKLHRELEAPENSTLNHLLRNLLYPAVIVYALATAEGIKVDEGRCKEVRQTLTEYIQQIEQRLSRYASNLNFSSPKQLAELLYHRWSLPTLVVTATGQPSTNEETLKMLLDWCKEKGKDVEAEFLNLLLHYRELTKIKSTYIDGVIEFLCSDGRVRPSWLLHSSVSGRVMCSKPSLQQIPARSEYTNLVRSIFVPEDGWVFIEMDFSNHELRVAASLAKDETAREIFVSGRDIHREVAAKIFNKRPEDVTDAERQAAKGVNFGILYGMSPSTLASSLKISDTEAQMFFNGFYELFPKVREWQQKLIKDAKVMGYVETPTGRRRRLLEIKDSDPTKQSRAIRQALNSPVQSYASDLCVLTAIEWTQRALKLGLRARIALTIHDSILIHAPEPEVPQAVELLAEAIKVVEEREKLFVPLEVEIAILKECWQKAEKIRIKDALTTLLAS